MITKTGDMITITGDTKITYNYWWY
jgi:hypothetical protein